MSPPGRTRLFVGIAGLYLAQGVIAAFGSNILIPQLAAAGIALGAQVDLLTLGALPWVFKLVWALALDLVFGPGSGTRRRTLLVGLSIACTLFATWMMATPQEPSSLATLTWLWVAINLVLSMQDVTVDGLAVDLLTPDERGPGNTWMQVGVRVGQLGLGGLLLAVVTVNYGLATAMQIWVGLLTLCVLAPAFLPTTRLNAQPTHARQSFVAALRALPRRPNVPVTLLAVFGMVGSAATSAVSPTFLFQELGLNYSDYTYTLLPLMVVCTLAAGPLSGRLIAAKGAHVAFAIGTAALGGTWAVFGSAEPLWPLRGTLLTLVCVEAAATVLCFSALYALLMAHTHRRIRAIHFTFYMMLLNVGRALAPTLAPDLLANVGYAGVWITCGLGQACLAIPAWMLSRRSSEDATATA